MTPELKAKELIDKYTLLLPFGSGMRAIKQCALVAVDEIINIAHPDPYDRKNNRSILDKQFWQEVKSKLEKL